MQLFPFTGIISASLLIFFWFNFLKINRPKSWNLGYVCTYLILLLLKILHPTVSSGPQQLPLPKQANLDIFLLKPTFCSLDSRENQNRLQLINRTAPQQQHKAVSLNYWVKCGLQYKWISGETKQTLNPSHWILKNCNMFISPRVAKYCYINIAMLTMGALTEWWEERRRICAPPQNCSNIFVHLPLTIFFYHPTGATKMTVQMHRKQMKYAQS